MDANLPLVACSLDAGEQPARLAAWRELAGRATSRREFPNGLRYTFPAELGDRLAGLVAAEQRCCPFLEFEVARSDREVAVTVTAEGSGVDALRFIFAA